MVDKLVIEELQNSIGNYIVFWDFIGRRYEGKILAVSEDYLKFYDTHHDNEKFFRLDRIMEVEIHTPEQKKLSDDMGKIELSQPNSLIDLGDEFDHIFDSNKNNREDC